MIPEPNDCTPLDFTRALEDLLTKFVDGRDFGSEPPEDSSEWQQGFCAALDCLREELKPWWPFAGRLNLANPTGPQIVRNRAEANTPVQGDGLVEELDGLASQIGSLPLSEQWMYSAIRHCERNMDFDYDDEGGEPDRQSGGMIARLVNALPRILSALRANGAA